jgi:hypothetical protein
MKKVFPHINPTYITWTGDPKNWDGSQFLSTSLKNEMFKISRVHIILAKLIHGNLTPVLYLDSEPTSIKNDEWLVYPVEVGHTQ